ncbi:hypothetical protein SEMRO_1187_G250460.1 [Seminavis robusta]|uniref:Uncharacterized protein n=1 Tax=Seminavis robusta TaxID=568900 RepID=A0A9N8EJN2_9STRA|nr:hypothetical protein SEMRO_1187_G250460.1 [Seminavis robusta]|eukprot:Sro1187_g250460.1 n/a (208) ;mRNA; r:9822-10445
MFNHFWKRSSKRNEDKDAISVCTSRSSGGLRSSKSKKSRPENKSKNKKDAAEIMTPNEHVAECFLAKVNAHASTEELLSFFTSSDAPIKFDDSEAMNAMVLATELQKVFAGFEDVTWNCGSIKEVKPNVVLLDDFYFTGTHTGPYQFANFPSVEATHKSIVLDPERCWFYMKGGKFKREETIALGNLTGPPGIYITVGGKMDSPPGE